MGSWGHGGWGSAGPGGGAGSGGGGWGDDRATDVGPMGACMPLDAHINSRAAAFGAPTSQQPAVTLGVWEQDVPGSASAQQQQQPAPVSQWGRGAPSMEGGGESTWGSAGGGGVVGSGGAGGAGERPSHLRLRLQRRRGGEEEEGGAGGDGERGGDMGGGGGSSIFGSGRARDAKGGSGGAVEDASAVGRTQLEESGSAFYCPYPPRLLHAATGDFGLQRLMMLERRLRTFAAGTERVLRPHLPPMPAAKRSFVKELCHNHWGLSK